jgi:hypothetical protein
MKIVLFCHDEGKRAPQPGQPQFNPQLTLKPSQADAVNDPNDAVFVEKGNRGVGMQFNGLNAAAAAEFEAGAAYEVTIKKLT